MAVQQWLHGEGAHEDPSTGTQRDLFENDFDDPLPF
jgi:hypothetical protein